MSLLLPPTKFLNLPPGQFVQELPPSTYLPWPQSSQVEEPTPANPPEQRSHEDWPVSGWYRPETQSTHSTARIEPAYLPESQSVHAVEPETEKAPAVHEKQ